MKKALIVVAIVAIIAITGSVIYYFVFFRIGIEKAEIRLQEQKFEFDKKELENLDRCLKEADDWYIEMLISAKKDNITFDAEGYAYLNKILQEKKDDCYRRYDK